MIYQVNKDGLAFFVSSKKKAEFYASNGYEVTLIDTAESSKDDDGVVISVTGVGRSKASQEQGAQK